jgi:ribosomal protein S18 acetylase RimI-like enzyme
VIAVRKPADPAPWPSHLRPGAIRFTRTSRHYDLTIAFYRDLVGLRVIDEFTGSYGEDGTIFGLPGTTVQLEVVRGHDPVSSAGLDYFVVYLDDAAAVATATAPLRAAGHVPVPDPHPYWLANKAVAFHDPDGREVMFAPWVYGRDPEPSGADAPPAVRIDWYDGPRASLRHLFAEAEDSAEQLDGYLHAGRVLAAFRGEALVGHLQLVPVDKRTVELKSMAVIAELRGSGIGRALVDTALAAARVDGAHRVLVATAAADVGTLRFYQRCGFRFLSVERDAFTPETGYPQVVVIHGIPLRDRVWLDHPLNG